MPEQTNFFQKNWQAIVTSICIPILMWVATNYEEKGYMKAKIESNNEKNEILDKYLDVSNELAECEESEQH